MQVPADVRTFIGLVAFTTSAASVSEAGDSPWKDVPADRSTAPLYSSVQRELELDLDGMRALLARAPSGGTGIPVELPVPEGGYRTFLVTRSEAMPEKLAARFPMIRTFQGVDQKAGRAGLRAELTTRGFHAMVTDGGRVEIVEPLKEGRYVSVLRGACDAKLCPTPATRPDFSEMEMIPDPPVVIPGALPPLVVHRTYRIAVSATGRFTDAWGGTVAGGLSGVAQAVNRISGILARDVAVTLTLVEDNQVLIFTSATDPFPPGPYGRAHQQETRDLVNRNRVEIDSRIGVSNYDLGHVLAVDAVDSGWPGGWVCSEGKAEAYTATPSPVADLFWVDYFAHEIGHQLGATHTFNSSVDRCSGNARSASSAYEPGGGTTVMAFGVLCGEIPHASANPYFHSASIEQMLALTASLDGQCGRSRQTHNTPPAANAGPSHVIPARTPFYLDGSAVDAEGDPLTFSWEEFDLGPASPPDTDDGRRPLFRSYAPDAAGRRYFPPLRILRTGTTAAPFEVLPTTSRTLTFRLTARDNHPGDPGDPADPAVGGVAWDIAKLEVVDSGTPFAVTRPAFGAQWPAGGVQTVEWSVAATDRLPVECREVNILMSVDEGDRFPYVLAARTPNDGSQPVSVPNTTSPPYGAFVWVECATAPFFHLSPAFTVVRSPLPPTN